MEIFISFIAASALLALAPGPDNIFVLLQSALYGVRVGIVIVCGLCTGLIFHTTVVILGVATLLKTSSTAFLALKIIGAAYLLYLAYLTARAKPITIETSAASHAAPTLSLWQYYRRGIFMNITNPKVTLFFLAFLPQFTYSTTRPIWQQIIVLALIFTVVGFVIFLLIAIFSGYFGRILRQKPTVQLILNRITVIVFIGLAIRLLW